MIIFDFVGFFEAISDCISSIIVGISDFAHSLCGFSWLPILIVFFTAAVVSAISISIIKKDKKDKKDNNNKEVL